MARLRTAPFSPEPITSTSFNPETYVRSAAKYAEGLTATNILAGQVNIEDFRLDMNKRMSPYADTLIVFTAETALRAKPDRTTRPDNFSCVAFEDEPALFKDLALMNAFGGVQLPRPAPMADGDFRENVGGLRVQPEFNFEQAELYVIAKPFSIFASGDEVWLPTSQIDTLKFLLGNYACN